MKFRTRKDTTLHSPRWTASKSQCRVGKNVEQVEPSYTAGGNVNWWTTMDTMDNSMEIPHKTRVIIQSSNPAPGHISGKNCD